MAEKKRCKAMRWDRWHEAPCTKPAVRNGFCAVHHPTAEAKRTAKSRANIRAKAAFMERMDAERERERKDAARWRWWRKWWCDQKDDLETINSVREYDGDSEEAFESAVDRAMAKRRRPAGGAK